MKIRIIALLFAALLLAGTAASAVQPTDDGRNITQAPALSGEPAAIALAHAGLTDQEITDLKIEQESENGIPESDVEFRSGDWEYAYAISVSDGEILSWEKEYDPEVPAAVPQPSVPAEPAQPAAISPENAAAIALAHAGLSEDQISGLLVKKDYDDGRWEFDVDFRQDAWEYEYEISAEDGEILSWDKEYDPEVPVAAPQPSAPAEPAQPAAISPEDAAAIALAHAGLTEDQVSRLKVEKDYDDGRWEYEVDFCQDAWEYEYEISAEDGKILSWDKEIDD